MVETSRDKLGNILHMSHRRQWLELALEDLEPGDADRVRAFRLLMVQGTRLRTLLDRRLAPSGLTSQQGAMLSWIEAQARAPTLSAVAAGLAMTHQNVKQIAAALARKGFLEIVPDETDKRARRLVLTDRQRQFWRDRNPNDFAAIQAWLSTWSDQDAREFVRLLLRLSDHLDAVEGSSERAAHPGGLAQSTMRSDGTA